MSTGVTTLAVYKILQYQICGLIACITDNNVHFTYCCSIIVSVRETCADWLRGVEPHDDPALKGKKDSDDFHIRVPRRNVGPSSTQVSAI